MLYIYIFISTLLMAGIVAKDPYLENKYMLENIDEKYEKVMQAIGVSSNYIAMVKKSTVVMSLREDQGEYTLTTAVNSVPIPTTFKLNEEVDDLYLDVPVKTTFKLENDKLISTHYNKVGRIVNHWTVTRDFSDGQVTETIVFKDIEAHNLYKKLTEGQ